MKTSPTAVVVLAVAILMGRLVHRPWLPERPDGRPVRHGQGLAERDVTADLAIWPLQLVAASGPRYVVQQVLMVRTEDPAAIRRARQAIGDLKTVRVVATIDYFLE